MAPCRSHHHTRQNWIFSEIHQELSPFTCDNEKNAGTGMCVHIPFRESHSFVGMARETAAMSPALTLTTLVRRREKRKKDRFYIYLDVTHAHAHIH